MTPYISFLSLGFLSLSFFTAQFPQLQMWAGIPPAKGWETHPLLLTQPDPSPSWEPSSRVSSRALTHKGLISLLSGRGDSEGRGCPSQSLHLSRPLASPTAPAPAQAGKHAIACLICSAHGSGQASDASCVTLGKCFCLSGPQFPPLENGNANRTERSVTHRTWPIAGPR